MSNPLKIIALSADGVLPLREYDFTISGDYQDVETACAADHACGCDWYYIVTESIVQPGLWFCWQEKGGAQ